jgi:DNA-binding LytR/AlgR family response regulator
MSVNCNTVAAARFTCGEMCLRIGIKSKERILLVDTADIIAVEAKGSYVVLKRTSGSQTLRGAMSAITEILKPFGFVRIHRSVLVNTAMVQEIEPRSTGEYLLRLKGAIEYTVSRTYKKNLRHLAQSWIGTRGFSAQ